MEIRAKNLNQRKSKLTILHENNIGQRAAFGSERKMF